jgi:hypothetical protein
MGLLEQRGVEKVDDLRDPDDQKMAVDLLAACVRLCRAAVSVDPTIAERSSFVKDVLHAAETAVERRVRPAPTNVVTGDGDHPVDAVPFRPPRRGVDVMVLGAGDSLAGGLGLVGDVARFDGSSARLGLTLGVGGTLGQWRGALAAGADVDVGARASLGGPVGVAGGVFYSPGFVMAEGRPTFSYRSYRAMVGMYFRSTTVGVAWQESNRGADATLRTVGGYVELGF